MNVEAPSAMAEASAPLVGRMRPALGYGAHESLSVAPFVRGTPRTVPHSSDKWHLLPPKECEEQPTVVTTNTGAKVIHDGSQILYVDDVRGINKIVTFDPESILSFSSMGRVSGTVFTLMPVLREICGSLLAGVITAVLVCFFVNPKNFDTTQMNILINFLMVFLGFMTGIFVNSAFNGWREINVCLNNLLQAIKSIYLSMNTMATKPIEASFEEDRSHVRRWGFLSLGLCAKEASANWDRGIDWDSEFNALHEVGLVSNDEAFQLNGKHIKASLPWVWILRKITELSEAGKLPKKDTRAFVMLLEECNTAQKALHNIAQQVLIQVPYQYVHMVAFLIHVFNILNAVRSGGQVGASVAEFRASGDRLPSATQCESVLINTFLVVLVPLVYHAFLSIACDLSIPFGLGDTDLPVAYLTARFQYECNDMDGFLQMPMVGSLARSSRGNAPSVIRGFAGGVTQNLGWVEGEVTGGMMGPSSMMQAGYGSTLPQSAPGFPTAGPKSGARAPARVPAQTEEFPSRAHTFSAGAKQG